MIEKYFYDIELYQRKETPDELGGFTITYTNIGKVKGLLEQSSTSERMVAAQLGIKNIYTFMTKEKIEEQGLILRVVKNGLTAIMTSEFVEGQNTSETMKDILQCQAESYVFPSGAIIK